MMIASLLLATLEASAAPADHKSETVQNRSFYVIGWPCDGKGCHSNPRRLGPNLSFKVPTSEAGFDRAKKLGQSWSVTLECSILIDQLVKCKVADDTVGSAEAQSVALGLSRFFQIESGNTAEKHKNPRAIVSIQYDTSGCPSWMCSITPPPNAKNTAVNLHQTHVTPLTALVDKQYCRSEESTGSMFPKKVCHTKAEWTAIAAQNANNTDRVARARQNTGRPGN